MLVWHKLSYRDRERDLYSTRQATKNIRSDQGVDVFRDCSQNARNQRQEVAADEEPSPPKDVAKTSDYEKAYRQAKRIGKSHPRDVIRWSDALVDKQEA